jgi:hypothetical protein
MSKRETVVELPFAAGCFPCVEKLRTLSPLTVGIRDGAVQLVSTLSSAVISARAELGSVIVSASPVATVLTRQRVCVCVGARVCACMCVLQREETHLRLLRFEFVFVLMRGRAVGKLFVVPAWAPPVPVSDTCIGPKIVRFSYAKAGFTAVPGRQHNC